MNRQRQGKHRDYIQWELQGTGGIINTGEAGGANCRTWDIKQDNNYHNNTGYVNI